jgi:HAMP domain-containing protein
MNNTTQLTQPTPQEMLSQLGNIDPKFAAILNVLASQQHNSSNPIASDAADQIERLNQKVNRLVQQNKALLRQTRELAAVIGACAHCFGTDIDCTNCSGLGSPGSVFPNMQLFETYVSPVIQALDARVVSRRRVHAAAVQTASNDTSLGSFNTKQEK